jgi:sulfite exporter TauE/SafE
MTEIVAGFALGVAGSLHCAGMCGPLVLALPHVRTRGRAALYHAARVLVYVIAGLIGGTIGHAWQLAGVGRVLSVLAGASLLWLAARRIGLTVGSSRSPLAEAAGRLLGRVTVAIRRRTADQPLAAVLGAGVLNALLPCGLLYAALTAAAGFGTASGAVWFMASFGAGTVPALAAISLLERSISPMMRSHFRVATPLALALIGLLLIARGTLIPMSLHMHMHAGQSVDQMHVHGSTQVIDARRGL